MKVGISGINGTMGQILSKKVNEDNNLELVMGIDNNPLDCENSCNAYVDPNDSINVPELIIDFSHPSYLERVVDYASKHRIRLVIATTGYSEKQMQYLENLSQSVPILYSANMSFGINVITSILKRYTNILSDSNYDIEIIEKHHNKKADAPSGTAYLLADTINESLDVPKRIVNGREGKSSLRSTEEIGIHAVRGGSIFGQHEILFAGDSDIIEINHTALSKDVFAHGAIAAAKWLNNKENGLYSMQDMFDF